MKFGSSQSTPQQKVNNQILVHIDQDIVETVIQVDRPQVEKIIYVNKPFEVIKTIEVPVEVIKYVDREVIKEVEKPVIIEKVVLVEAATPPPEIKEVIVEKVIEKEIKVKNEVNTILIYVIALSLLANLIQGMF